MTAKKTSETRGVHHVGLTVSDHEAAASFFIDALGFEKVGGVESYPSIFVSDGNVMLTLWRAEDPATARPFDRRSNLGLHHLALAIDGERIDALAASLASRSDVEIEFAPQPVGTGGARHLMLTIPGGIRLELFAAAQAA